LKNIGALVIEEHQNIALALALEEYQRVAHSVDDHGRVTCHPRRHGNAAEPRERCNRVYQPPAQVFLRPRRVYDLQIEHQ